MTWFRCTEEQPSASLRLFCFPHAGGSAGFYRSWARPFGPAVEVRAVQYPGRADRFAEPLAADAHELARSVADAMDPLLDRPAALFGHSMGALIAYEVARLLAERGAPAVHLFASASRAPHDRAGLEEFSWRSDDALLARLAELDLTNTAALANRELRELVLPSMRNDFALVERYVHRPGPRLTHPVTALAGDADPLLDAARVAEWRTVTDGAFVRRVLPGDHFYLVPGRSQVIDEVARTLRAYAPS